MTIIRKGSPSKANSQRERERCFILEKKKKYTEYGCGSKFSQFFPLTSLFSRKSGRTWSTPKNWRFMEERIGNWMKRIKNLKSGSLGHLLGIFCLFSCTISLHWLCRWFLEVCRDHFQKAFGLKLSSYLWP